MSIVWTHGGFAAFLHLAEGNQRKGEHSKCAEDIGGFAREGERAIESEQQKKDHWEDGGLVQERQEVE